MRALATALLVVLCAAPGPARAATPPGDPEAAPSLHCVERVAIPAIADPLDAQWSPDGARLAVVWSAPIPSRRTPVGIEETELIDVLDVRTGRLAPVGVGARPQWSSSGTYLSYWGPDAEELRVVRDARVVAVLAPTIPEVRWAGDTLIFIEKDRLRLWREGVLATITTFAADFVPRYPRDDVYFSADGRFYTITRYERSGEILRFVGSTLSGTPEALDVAGAPYVEWAPRGATLLVRHLDRIELREPDGAARAVLLGAHRVHLWSPAGELLLGRVSPTVPAGDAFDPFYASTPARERIATIPNVLGARAFSPDGRFFVGASRTGAHSTRLELYRCRGAARVGDVGDAPARLAALDREGARFVRPVAGAITQYVRGSHTGIDVGAPYGSLVTASAAGVVTSVDRHPNGGERVCLAHDATLESCYYHLSVPLVAAGDRVVRGEPIAMIGMTGLTTGPHVHWELEAAGRIVDPLAR